jgi:hypothetical protein
MQKLARPWSISKDSPRLSDPGEQENPALRQNQGSYGTRVISATPIQCDAGNGKDVIPTEEGKELLKFFRLAKSKGLLTDGIRKQFEKNSTPSIGRNVWEICDQNSHHPAYIGP